MVRPKDLPQPVREHKPHDSLQDSYKSGASPGPCAYDGLGVTVFNRSRKLGFMPQAQRFRYKEDSTVGPIYNPTLSSTAIGISIKGRHDSSASKQSQGPGPGEYNIPQQWEGHGVGFTQGKRNSFGRGTSAPAPGTYDPAKPRIRNAPSAFIGSSTRATGSILSTSQRDCDPQIASLAAMDTALGATRTRAAQIGFAKSTRNASSSIHDDSHVGPGSYDAAASAKHTDRSVHGVVFGSATHTSGGPSTRKVVDPPLIAPPQLNASSQKVAAPAISFSKATYERGLPMSASVNSGSHNASVRAPLSNVSYSQLDPSSKVIPWRPSTAQASRFGTTSRSDQSSVGPGAVDVKSTLGGPQVSFSRGTRSAGARRDPSPGPAAYSPQLPRRPESAAQSFTKAKRQGIPVADEDAAPGPKYNPIVTPRLSIPAISFPKGCRDTRPSTAGSADASYSPVYSHVDKSSHGAILYLTG